MTQTAARVAPKKKIFYGWYIVALAFIGLLMSVGLRAFALTIFFKPMTGELRWTRSVLSGAQSLGHLVEGLLAPFLGGIIDRRGSRAFMVFGGLMTGFALVTFSQVQNAWHIYFLRGFVLTIGLLCIGNLVVNVAICNWFVRKRGRAIAFAATGISVGGIILPHFVTFLISNLGWRMAWVVLGVLVSAIITMPAALIMKRRPEDVGLHPDGEQNPRIGSSSPVRTKVIPQKQSLEPIWSRKEALRTRAFWLIVPTFGIATAAMLSIQLHMVPYLIDMGFSPVIAAATVSLHSTTMLLVKPIWGFAVERIDVRILAAIKFLIETISFLILLGPKSLTTYFLAFGIYGMGVGGTTILQEVIWANYYGRLTLGAIRGLGMPLLLILGSLGPIYMGYLYDITNSYTIPFTTFAVGLLLSAFLILLAKPPKAARFTQGHSTADNMIVQEEGRG